MSVAIFPFHKTVQPLSNDPRHEFLHDVLEGLEPARKKRIIMRARDPSLQLIDDVDAAILIDAYGLREV